MLLLPDIIHQQSPTNATAYSLADAQWKSIETGVQSPIKKYFLTYLWNSASYCPDSQF